MNQPLQTKVEKTVRWLRKIWKQTEGRHRFVAFSTGKDSLALAAMLYEAVEHERPPCLYVQHEVQFPVDSQYLDALKTHGFDIQVLRPFLNYFQLTERGIGFVSKTEPWCIPMLIGTALVEWLRLRDARSPRSGVMFRGISGSEWSRKYHAKLEIYRRLNLPTVNPMLRFTTDQVLTVLRQRYALPLNPLYDNVSRTYCICCYAPDRQRQAYAQRRFPDVHSRFYGHIEECLLDSGLIETDHVPERYRTKQEQLHKHGFMHWRRSHQQDAVGAVKRRLHCGALSYAVREHSTCLHRLAYALTLGRLPPLPGSWPLAAMLDERFSVQRGTSWIDSKHLLPVAGKWSRSANEIRFWDVPERQADAIMKRMMNCLDCGFCTVQCFACRRFDRNARRLRIEGCVQCGRCLNLAYCMGWKHRFWRRVIVEASDDR
jgi:3'-phosphoadenosine 5'-phosphosulfate sulfotransferase (PAPS reductase)/FAD synthetase/ferredoxin